MSLEREIDQLLARHVQPDGPGAAVAVLQNGEFMHRKAYGLADLEWATPLRPDCVFRIASLTKQFTAVAIMMLDERGALSLEAPIERYLADWQPRGRRVTARHLLNHTSGIWVHDRAEAVRALGPYPSLIDEVRLVCSREFAAEPGAVYRYNNGGYLLLGAIIERLSGLSFGDFLRRNIFEPLGNAPYRLAGGRGGHAVAGAGAMFEGDPGITTRDRICWTGVAPRAGSARHWTTWRFGIGRSGMID